MPTPRKQQISLSDTPYYHCISRCVRRTFLCGIDRTTNKDYSHRRQWIAERLALLSKTFAIDVCAYAILSNHSHIVLKINASLAQSWTDEEVMQRWQQVFSIPVLVERYLNGKCHSEAECDKAQETITLFRDRLMDISWFMRCLNEHIARKANAEDNCTGRFWEGRFKSQALLDEQATTNPDTTPAIKLTPFISSALKENGISFSLKDYLELTDWTGRIVREDKRGHIDSSTPGILKKLALDEQTWVKTVRGFSAGFHTFVGPEDKLQSLCQKQKKHWVRGINVCRKLFKSKPLCPIPA